MSVSLETDLSSFSRFLSAQGVEHQIVECDGRQVLRSHYDRVAILTWFEQWYAGELEMPASPPKVSNIQYSAFLKTLLRYPVVITTSALAVLISLMVADNNMLILWLAFQDIGIDEQNILYTTDLVVQMTDGQWWRLLTPIFLHFTSLHLVFNGLWLIEFGRRIESLQSHGRLITLIVVGGIVSNVCQYVYEPSILFGGLSGVVYALFGYCWMWAFLESLAFPGCWTAIAPQPGVAPFLLFWLLLCMSGVLSLVDIHVANAAHLGGLMSGLLMAFIYRFRFLLSIILGD